MSSHSALAFQSSLPLSCHSPLKLLSSCRPPRAARPRVTTVTAVLSERFPLPDPFSFPSVAFTQPSIYPDLRPELVGACLWGVGLYLGFSQRVRWGTAVQNALNATLLNFLPLQVADVLASVFHTLPFLIAAFTTDALLRYASAGSATWAVASGLSVAMYGGVYELARSSVRSKKLTDDDKKLFQVFTAFAERTLAPNPNGRCHLIDIRSAIRNDPNARALSAISDETLRRFVRTKFPNAKRSPNGFYRGLSIRQL
ncbi:unnamed protein product [Agarophyton chilense]